MSAEKTGIHITRLDSIRLLAAVWVVLSHGAVPWKSLAHDTSAKFVLAGIGSTFSGISAVMIFFIVSGLCIHLPYSSGRPLPILSFLIRRYVRVGLPLVFIYLIAEFLGPESSSALSSVTWSVYAELFYYSLYPLLYFLSQRFGWRLIISASLPLSLGIVIANFGQTQVSSLGWQTWIWGLPIWLSGCLIAEIIRQKHSPGFAFPLWLWRTSVWAFSVTTTYLIYHSPIKVGLPVTMLMFALLGYWWLLKELQSERPAWPWLERGGAASYSLYLVHAIVISEVHKYVQFGPPLVDTIIGCVIIGASTYVMYRLVEAPCHRLARYLADLIGDRKSRSLTRQLPLESTRSPFSQG